LLLRTTQEILKSLYRLEQRTEKECRFLSKSALIASFVQ